MQVADASRATLLGALSTGLHAPRTAAMLRATPQQLVAEVLGGVVDAVDLRRRELAAREAERVAGAGDVLSRPALRFEMEAVDVVAAVAAPMAPSTGGVSKLLAELLHAAAAAFVRMARCVVTV